MAVETFAQNPDLSPLKLIRGQVNVLVPNTGALTVVGTPVSHSLNQPILYKIYFRIDSGSIIYYSPILNNALVSSSLYVYAYVGDNSLNFVAINGDTVNHTLNITYFLYADRVTQ